jgi:hypothetical protein
MTVCQNGKFFDRNTRSRGADFGQDETAGAGEPFRTDGHNNRAGGQVP